MGLRAGDLENLVYHIFEIDSFASKMGDDRNIVTISFSVKDKAPADDLVNFLESGYSFILDADATAGEQSDGTYKVFVELQREKSAGDHILEIVDGVGKLSNVDNFKFRYYKNWRSRDFTPENLAEDLPLDPDKYGIKVNESYLQNYKNFFNKSYLESVDMIDDVITAKKPFADKLDFDFIDFGEVNDIKESIKGKFDIMESYPEILFLTKYLGDYNISKYGDSLVFENEGLALVVKRK